MNNNTIEYYLNAINRLSYSSDPVDQEIADYLLRVLIEGSLFQWN